MITKEMIESAFENAVKTKEQPPMQFVSSQAFDMAKRILDIDPNFRPQCETEIWWKANELGLKK